MKFSSPILYITRLFPILMILLISTSHNLCQGSVPKKLTLEQEKRILFSGQQSNIMEPAGSHSSYRFYMGLGLKKLDSDTVSPNQDSHVIEEGELTIPQVTITTGLFYPVDFSVSMSRSELLSYQQVSASLQWTLYEAFAKPAVSGRLLVSQGKIWNSSEIETWTLQMLSSWGYKMISFYLGYTGNINTYGFYQNQGFITERSYGNNRIFGIHLQMIPALLYLVFESCRSSLGQNTLSIKLATEM